MKKNIKKSMVMVMSVVAIFGCINIPTYALSNGWKNATEVTGTKITTDAITSAKDEKWYKFTTTEENTTCAIQLYDVPSLNAYNVELRYQEETGKRPIILENTMQVLANGKAHLRMSLDNIGTYYVRVYSVTGEYSKAPYTLTISRNTSGFSMSVTRVDGDGEKYDWAACAEMLGKYYYKDVFGTELTTRNYKNAARFIQSSGEDDDETSAKGSRGTLENTALATNYMFAGDYMAKPVFKVTNSIKTATDFHKYMYSTNQDKCQMPVIVRMSDHERPEERFARYLLVKGISYTYNELDAIDPDISGSKYIDISEAIYTYDDGYYVYNNEAIVLDK